MMEYRAEILLWVLVGCFPFIMMGVWAKATGNGAYAMNPTQVIQYFIAVFIVRQFTIVWVIWEFERAVVEGQLSSMLLKPIDPVWSFVAMHFSEQASRLPFWAGIVVVAFCCWPQAIWVPHVGTLALGILAIVLAFTLRFVLQYTFAMLSFWIERASAIEQLSFLPYMFLSGMGGAAGGVSGGRTGICAVDAVSVSVGFSGTAFDRRSGAAGGSAGGARIFDCDWMDRRADDFESVDVAKRIGPIFRHGSA